MKNLLKNAHDKAEELEGSRLLITLIATFVVFVLLGIGINYITSNLLNNNEFDQNRSRNGVTTLVEETFEEGVITYVDPNFYPNDNISFYLADTNGKEVILLKAQDQKLEVSEGLFVKVYGRRTKTQDKEKDVLLVERVVVKNTK